MNLPESEAFTAYFEDNDFKAETEELFAKVDPEVQQFAQDHGLELEKWYNDLPLWLLRLPKTPDDIIRTIHLGAAKTNDKPDLGILVDAYSDEAEANTRHGLVRAKLISKYSEIDPLESTRFSLVLSDAYETARNISREELLRTTPLRS